MQMNPMEVFLLFTGVAVLLQLVLPVNPDIES